ncbi:hypothetical protein EDD11_008849 [Mortierella claussenii]|nr:hypothetical protein EDD11_008849 [Mortierella claussenii]
MVTRSREATEGSESLLPIATLSVSKRDGRVRWCEICKIVKPDRCHHCSECNSCVLRMDHHCPWVNRCIGFGNYKYFYLFILYGSISAVWVVASMIPVLLQVLRKCRASDAPWGKKNSTVDMGRSMHNMSDWSADGCGWKNSQSGLVEGAMQTINVHWIIITVITFLLAMMIVSFSGAHTSYLLTNRTTIEALQNVRNTFIRVQYRKMDSPSSFSDAAMAGPAAATGMMPSFASEIEFNVVMVEQVERLWDRGSWLANWNSIMGTKWWLWFVPYYNSPGDGIHEVYNERVYKRLVGDALAQARMQVVNFGLQGELTSNDGTTNSAGANAARPAFEGHTGTIVAIPALLAPVVPVPLTSVHKVPTGQPIAHSSFLSSSVMSPSFIHTADPGHSSRSRETGRRSPGASQMLRASSSNSIGPSDISHLSSRPQMPSRYPSAAITTSISEGALSRSIHFDYRDELSGLSPTSQEKLASTATSLLTRHSSNQLETLQGRHYDQHISQGDEGPSQSAPSDNYSGGSDAVRNDIPEFSRQRSSKSQSGSSTRHRQSTRSRTRTMSGGTSRSFGGPIREFGMGLGMDGVHSDSGTGLKMSSGLLGWSGGGGGRGASGHNSSRQRSFQQQQQQPDQS